MASTQASVEKLFAPMLLSTSAGTIYTVPSGMTLGHFRIRVTNLDTGDHTVTLYGVPNGAIPATANTFAGAEVVKANWHTDYDVPVLQGGDYLSALSSDGTHVTIHQIDGILFS
jgi:hypothetical protein